MSAKRKVEIFSAGCACCEETISKIQDIACPDCEIIVLDMNEAEVTQRARDLGVKSVPAVAIDGKLTSCCAGGGPRRGLAQPGVERIPALFPYRRGVELAHRLGFGNPAT